MQMRFHEDPSASRFKILTAISCKLTLSDFAYKFSQAFDPLLLRQSDPLPVSPVPSRKDSQYANPCDRHGVWESPYCTDALVSCNPYSNGYDPNSTGARPLGDALKVSCRREIRTTPQDAPKKSYTKERKRAAGKSKHRVKHMLMCRKSYSPTHMLGIESLNLPFASIWST